VVSKQFHHEANTSFNEISVLYPTNVKRVATSHGFPIMMPLVLNLSHIYPPGFINIKAYYNKIFKGKNQISFASIMIISFLILNIFFQQKEPVGIRLKIGPQHPLVCR
jgi:hypothetical protein